jgi:hypothetical protein
MVRNMIFAMFADNLSTLYWRGEIRLSLTEKDLVDLLKELRSKKPEVFRHLIGLLKALVAQQ